jgi:hypothetical protein
MHIATRRSGVTTNGPCIVGIPGLPFVTRLCIRARQPGEVRPHKPGRLVCTHACQVIKRRFTPPRCASMITLSSYTMVLSHSARILFLSNPLIRFPSLLT